MSIKIALTKGITDNEQYKAFKFPGGEIHLKFKDDFSDSFSNSDDDDEFLIHTRINSSDDLILFILAVDTLKKDWPLKKIKAYIPYMPYMQADRDFSTGECFSLATIARLLCSIPVDEYKFYDPHSDQTPGFFKMGGKRVKVVDNSEYVNWIVNNPIPAKNLILLSPDAGAYKKIYKLVDKIKFKGEVASANKSRSISTGNIDSIEFSREDFGGNDVLIVDDICIGGLTFLKLAEKLKERNVGNLYLAVSHGIFSQGFGELSKYYTNIFTTNTRQDKYNLGEGIDENFLQVYNVID